MKCPKCKYVSHDYLERCRRCGADLVAFKHDMGLLVHQPGGLDLSLVLGETGADDLFVSVAEEVIVHTGKDDDDAMSLAADPDQPGARRAVAPEANPHPAHVTIAMEPERTAAMARREADAAVAHVEAETGPEPSEVGEAARRSIAEPPGEGEDLLPESALPGHLRLELDASEITANWSSSTVDDVWLDDPPGAMQSKTATPQNEADDSEALQLDLDAFEIDDDTHA